jgi:hypothetical protein
LQDPKKFSDKGWSRTNGGKLYGKTKVPATVAIVRGKLKGKDKPADPPIAQSLRFPTKSWTADKARKWLKDNKVKYMLFEPAKPTKQTHEHTAAGSSKDPFIFSQQGGVEFADGDKEKNNVRLTLYDGSVVKHFFWGNLAFDLATMKLAKPSRTPILYEHDTGQRLGYSSSVSFEPKFVMEGTFLARSSKAQAIKNEMEEGFPFEASMKINPDKSTIEQVKDGDTVEVNGHQLKGPGTVFRNAVVMEGSICVFGALKNTVSEAFEIIENQNGKEQIMADEQTMTELTLDSFSADYPELHGQIVEAAKAEGRKEVRGRLAAFGERFKDDPTFCLEHLQEGTSLEEATTAFAAKCRTERDAALEQARKAAELAKKNDVDPAHQEFSDTQTDKQGDQQEYATPEEKYTAEFKGSKQIQAEFASSGGEPAYIAFRKAEEAGQVRIKSAG